MSLPATDLFNRGDGPIGSSWTDQGTDGTFDILSVASNAAVGVNTNASYVIGFWDDDVFNDAHYSQANVYNAFPANPSSQPGVLVRSSGVGAAAFKCYHLWCQDGQSANTRLFRVDAGPSYTQLQDFGSGWTDGHLAKLEVNGSTLRAYDQGVQIGTDQTDSTLSGGAAGIGIRNFGSSTTGNKLDNWEGGNIAAAAGFLLVKN